MHHEIFVVVPHALTTTCRLVWERFGRTSTSSMVRKVSSLSRQDVLGGTYCMYTAQFRWAGLPYMLSLFFGAHLYAWCRAPLGNRLRAGCTAAWMLYPIRCSSIKGNGWRALAGGQQIMTFFETVSRDACMLQARHSSRLDNRFFYLPSGNCSAPRSSASDYCPSSQAHTIVQPSQPRLKPEKHRTHHHGAVCQQTTFLFKTPPDDVGYTMSSTQDKVGRSNC
jgi:hypothetical protein